MAVLFLACGASVANCDPISAFIPAGGIDDYTASFQYTIGDRFITNQSIEVTSLGLYSVAGLGENYSVGLWDSNGNLLASAVVPETTLFGRYIYVSISPVILNAGEAFEIGTLINPTSLWLAETSITTSPEVTFVHGTYDQTFSTTLTAPTEFTCGQGWSGTCAMTGPNFQFVDAATVPEPSTLATLSASLLLTLFWLRLEARPGRSR